MSKKFFLPAFIIVMLLTAGKCVAQTLVVSVEGIRSAEGDIAIGLFRNDADFQDERACIQISFPKKDLINGKMTVQFSIAPGTYGLCVLDDENSDRQMEYGIFHIPREGFGFSDYYHSGLTKPRFERFSFNVSPGQVKNIQVRLRYI